MQSDSVIGQPILFQSDREGNWQHVDPAWHTLTGTDGATWLQAVHPTDRQQVRRAWQKALKHHSAFACTYRSSNGYTHIDRRASPTATGFIDVLTPLPQANLLDLIFNQALDGLFVMLLDEPIIWHDSIGHDGIDKEAALEFAFELQRLTRINIDPPHIPPLKEWVLQRLL